MQKNHIIPLVRLSTTVDPNNPSAWKKPTINDVIEAANFLDKLDWPTKTDMLLSITRSTVAMNGVALPHLPNTQIS